MFFYVILLGTFLALIIYWIYKYKVQWKYIERIPGPFALPFIGNAHQVGLNPAAYLKTLLTWWKVYDCDIFRAWIASQPYVIISNPRDIEAVLSSTTLLQKGDVYRFLEPWMGQGLLTGYGTRWHKFRKIITPSFHFSILIKFLEVMNKNSSNLIIKLKEKEKSGEVFDIQQIYHYCTLDVICETAMGTELNALNNNNSVLVTAFQDMCLVIQERFFSPLKQFDLLFKIFPFYQIQRKALKILKNFTMDVIEKRKKLLQNFQTKTNDDDENSFIKPKQAFLDNLLMTTVDDRQLTNLEIFEEVSTFMFEGHDTTSSGVTFCTYLLSIHPEVQEKLFLEQKLIFGDELNRRWPTYQDMENMKYLKCVLKESQRLYPSVPLIARYNTKPINLSGRYIPAYTTIVPFIIGMGYNAKYFDNPDIFDPDRFVYENRTEKDPFSYVPFSAGPRNCVGQKFAMLEMKSIISAIVRNYKILPGFENGTRPILAALLTLKSDNGVLIKLTERK